MLNNNHEELFRSLSEKIGCPIAFNEEGICDLTVGEEFIVSLEDRKDDGIIIMSSVVAPDLPDPISYPLLLDLMSLAIGPCVSGGGNSPLVAREPDSGVLVAYEVLTPSVLEKQDLTELFTDFLDFCMSVTAKIAGNTEIEETGAEKGDDLELPDGQSDEEEESSSAGSASFASHSPLMPV